MNATETRTAATIIAEEGESLTRVGEKAFDDETDLRNEDFIFIY